MCLITHSKNCLKQVFVSFKWKHVQSYQNKNTKLKFVANLFLGFYELNHTLLSYLALVIFLEVNANVRYLRNHCNF